MEFDLYYHLLKKNAVFNCIWIVLSLVGIIFSVAVVFVNRNKWYVSLGFALFVVLISIIYQIIEQHYVDQIKEYKKPLLFPITSSTIQRIVQGKIGECIEKDIYFLLTETKTGRFRELIQVVDSFDSKKIGADRKRINKKINQKYAISNEMPRFANWLRINLVVCNKPSEKLINWVNCNAEQLLRRNEAIVNVVILIEAKKMVFPIISQGIALDQFRSYERAFLFLSEQLDFYRSNGSFQSL